MSEVTMKCVGISEHVLDAATLRGALGEGSKMVDDAALALIHSSEHPDQYPLGGETRQDKFVNTFMTFTKAGAQAGAVVGDALMLLPDALIGRGGCHGGLDQMEKDPYAYFKQTGGLFGTVPVFTTIGLSGAAEAVGIGTGAVVGTVDFPANAAVQKPADEWYVAHMNGFGKAFATAVGGAVGFAWGAVMDVARLASLAVKYALMGVFAIGSAVVGFIGASFRGIINE